MIVTVAGLIGSFAIGVATQAQLRARLGAPTSVIPAITEPSGKRIGSRLVYGKTTWSFRGSVLADFRTRSPAFHTQRGSRVGLTARAAAAREHRPLSSVCGNPAIRVRWDARHQFFLTIEHGRVAELVYAGPRTTFYELC